MRESNQRIIYPVDGDPDTNILLRIRLKELGFFLIPVFVLIWLGATYESILNPIQSWNQNMVINILALVGLVAIIYELYVGLHEVVKIEATKESIILKYWSKPYEFYFMDIQSIEIKSYKWLRITGKGGRKYVFYLTAKRLFFSKPRKKEGFDRIISFLGENIDVDLISS